jgi:hypothetical protein
MRPYSQTFISIKVVPGMTRTQFFAEMDAYEGKGYPCLEWKIAKVLLALGDSDAILIPILAAYKQPDKLPEFWVPMARFTTWPEDSITV